MSDNDEFDDDETTDLDEDLEDEDLDEDALADEDADDDLDLELEGDDLDEAVEVDAEIEQVGAPEIPQKAVATRTGEDEEDEDVLDLDEELHPDDVEAPLDALLQERTAAATLEDEEEEVEDEEVDGDAPGDGPTKIVPRRPGEFLCSSCFLVLPRNQLADERRMLCRDCA